MFGATVSMLNPVWTADLNTCCVNAAVLIDEFVLSPLNLLKTELSADSRVPPNS